MFQEIIFLYRNFAKDIKSNEMIVCCEVNGSALKIHLMETAD